jgi:hypothetical protein
MLKCDKEASQTRDYCVAKNATLRLRSGQATSRGLPGSFTARRMLVLDDKQTGSLFLRNGFLVYWFGIGELEPEAHHFFVAGLAPAQSFRGVGILGVVV